MYSLNIGSPGIVEKSVKSGENVRSGRCSHIVHFKVRNEHAIKTEKTAKLV